MLNCKQSLSVVDENIKHEHHVTCKLTAGHGGRHCQDIELTTGSYVNVYWGGEMPECTASIIADDSCTCKCERMVGHGGCHETHIPNIRVKVQW